MVARLAQLADEFEQGDYPYVASALLRQLMAVPPQTDPIRRISLSAAIADQLFHAGRIQEASERFEQLLVAIGQAPAGAVPPEFAQHMRVRSAAAYFQLSQQANCVEPASTARCLVPTPPEGVHVEQEAARKALEMWKGLLEDEPGNVGWRWLVNIAHMALGTYPDSVPARWLIDPRAFSPEYEVGRFRDVASDVGLDMLGHAGGMILDDFSGDGHLDVVASQWGVRDPIRYWVNNADGTFTERTVEAGLQGLFGGLNIVHADYNNDGWLDILVLRGGWILGGHPNSLLRNNGDGTFDDVTDSAGLLDPWHGTQTACWIDHDNDGWVDLFIGNESMPDRLDPSQLFQNNRDGTFTNVAREARAEVIGYIKGVACGDVDNDGYTDIFVSRKFQPNVLLRGNGPDTSGQWTYADVTGISGVAAPVSSFTTWFWDYDNDGWTDILVAGTQPVVEEIGGEYLDLPYETELTRLYRNDGDGTFTDVTEQAQLERGLSTMGANYGDLDNDGFLDFYVGTGDMDFDALLPNRMFRNAAGERFQEVTFSGGFGHLQKGHGIGFGDVDHDGDQDILAQFGGAYEGDLAYSTLFENPGHGNAWVTLALEGVDSNRAAIGARVKVTIDGEPGPRDIYRTVSSGGSFGGNSLQLEIGLGGATRITSIAVSWPVTGRTDLYTDVEINRAYRLREGAAALEPRDLAVVRLSP